jgi:DNA-binding PadR family transcriptional regulator
MARRTATTANAILGLLALREEWATWELTKQLRRNMRFFWPRAESQIYEEAKALVGRGWARDRRTFVGRRARTNYSITPDGRRALAAWLATPPKPTALECEPLLRVFLADFGTREQLRAAIEQIRADATAILDVGRVVGPGTSLALRHSRPLRAYVSFGVPRAPPTAARDDELRRRPNRGETPHHGDHGEGRRGVVEWEHAAVAGRSCAAEAAQRRIGDDEHDDRAHETRAHWPPQWRRHD